MIDLVNSVKSFTPTFLNIDNSSLLAAHANAIKSIDENNEKANKALAELNAAVGEMDMSEGDEYIKRDLLNHIKQVVNDNSTSLGIGTAYNSIVKELGDISSNPLVTTALQNQKRSKENIDAINKMDIDNDMKEMYLDLTKYNGIQDDDINRDEDGNIVSIKKWQPITQPTKQINLNEMLLTALKYMNPDLKGTSNIIFYDNNNKPTQQLSEAAYYINSANEREYLSPEKVKDAINSAILANSAYMASLKQDYIRAGWYYRKYNDNTYGFKNEDGSERVFSEYLDAVFDPVINSIQYTKDVTKKQVSVFESRLGASLSGSVTDRVNRILKNVPAINKGVVAVTEDVGEKTRLNAEVANQTIVDTFKEIYQDLTVPEVITKLKENGLDIYKYSKYEDIPKELLTPENIWALQLIGCPMN